MNKVFAVMVVKESAQLNTGHDVPLNFSDGMIGVIPVFESKDLALKYAGDFRVCEFLLQIKPELMV